MEPLTIVDVVDESTDRGAGVIEITIVSAVDLLLLECLHEALRLGIVVRVADAAHARLDVMGLKHRRVLAAGLLDDPVGMMDQAARHWPARRDGHAESLSRE